MGCDIHMNVEKRNKKGEWDCVDTIQYIEERNYNAFGQLCHVRTAPDKCISDAPRGWPDDVTEESMNMSTAFGVDGHSHSYATMGDILELMMSSNQQIIEGYIQHNLLEYIDAKTNFLSSDFSWALNETYHEKFYPIRAKAIVSDFHLQKYLDALCEVMYSMGDDYEGHDEPLRVEVDPSSIRLVFFFDN